MVQVCKRWLQRQLLTPESRRPTALQVPAWGYLCVVISGNLAGYCLDCERLAVLKVLLITASDIAAESSRVVVGEDMQS